MLYSYIPSSFRICNPELKYASWRDGFGIKNAVGMNASFDKEKEIGVVLLIKTIKNEEIGAFFDCPFQLMNSFQGTHSCFVFQLKPSECIFQSTEINNSYILVKKDSITIGEGVYGPAIQLDEALDKGTTCLCDTFNSPPLTEPITIEESLIKRVDFRAGMLELFVLQ